MPGPTKMWIWGTATN